MYLSFKEFFTRIVYNLTAFFFKILSYFIPKKKRYYALYPLHDTSKLSGNIRAMALYLHKCHKNIEIVVITNNKTVKNELKELGIKSHILFAGFSWTLLRAEFVFIDASVSRMLTNSRVSIIQLWHGVGFKNIALLNNNLGEKSLYALSKFFKKYALLITSSNDDFKKKKDSFKSPHIVITGSPRNDIFFASSSYFDKIKKQYNLELYSKIITYAPTFRDFETTKPFSNSFWESLQEYLEKTNQVFVVKKHPWEKHLNVPKNLLNVKDLSKLVSDPQELLLVTDLLISDYSSITTDFALTNRPILIYAYDFEAYKNNCRSVYYDLEKILPKPFIYNEEVLLKRIKSDDWTRDKNYIDSYNTFKATFHKYIDGNSSQRVMNEVLKL